MEEGPTGYCDNFCDEPVGPTGFSSTNIYKVYIGSKYVTNLETDYEVSEHKYIDITSPQKELIRIQIGNYIDHYDKTIRIPFNVVSKWFR